MPPPAPIFWKKVDMRIKYVIKFYMALYTTTNAVINTIHDYSSSQGMQYPVYRKLLQ